MTRTILALIALLAAAPVFAQGEAAGRGTGAGDGTEAGIDFGRIRVDARSRGRDPNGVHLRILNNYDLPVGATASEPIVVIGGSAVIHGHAEQDVVVIAGSLRVGPTAVIGGDVAAIGSEAVIDPAARISGEVDRATIIGPDFDLGIGWISNQWWLAVAFGATLLRLAIVLIVSMLLVVVAPGWIASISQRVASMPLASAGIGIAAQVLFVPAVIAVTIALVISVVGILLLLAFPFVFGAGVLLWIAGFAAVATSVGARLRAGGPASSAPVRDLLVGFVLITAVTLLAQAIALMSASLGPVAWVVRPAGWLIEWAAWTVGLGAGLAGLLGGRYPATPPPIPSLSPAPTTS